MEFMFFSRAQNYMREGFLGGVHKMGKESLKIVFDCFIF